MRDISHTLLSAHSCASAALASDPPSAVPELPLPPPLPAMLSITSYSIDDRGVSRPLACSKPLDSVAGAEASPPPSPLLRAGWELPASANDPNRMKFGELCRGGTWVTIVRPLLRERLEVSRGEGYGMTVSCGRDVGMGMPDERGRFRGPMLKPAPGMPPLASNCCAGSARRGSDVDMSGGGLAVCDG